MATIGEAIVKFTSDASATLKAMTDVGAAAETTNTKSTEALSKYKEQMKATTEASQEFSKKFMDTAAAVGAAALGFAYKAVDAYNEHNQVLAQMDAALKSTGDASKLSAQDMLEQSEAIQRLTGVSRNAVLAGSNMLQTFTNLQGPQFQGATQAVVDMATALNGGAIPNMEQTREQALQLGKALNDPATGLSMLRREGVTFTTEQKDQVKAMEAAGNMAGAQTLMLKELEKEFGGSAMAAGNTFAGGLAKAKNTVDDFMVSVGDLVVRQLTPLLQKFNEWVEKMGGTDAILQKLMTSVQDLGKWIMAHRDQILLVAGAIAGPLLLALGAAVLAFGATVLALAPVMLAGAAVMLMLEKWVQHHGGLKQSMDDLEAKFKEAERWYNSHQALIKNIIIPAVEALIGTIVALKAMMAIGQAVAAAQESLAIFKTAMGATQGGVSLLGGSLAALPLAITIGVAMLGYELIKQQIDGLKGDLDGLAQSAAKISGTDNAIQAQIAKIKAEPKSAANDARIADLQKAYQTTAPTTNLNAFQSLLLGVPKFAEGVKNFPGGLALVGEQGPELVRLPSGSDVIPNNALGTPSSATHSAPASQVAGQQVTVNLQLGMFAGTPGELSKIAERLSIEINRLSQARGIA